MKIGKFRIAANVELLKVTATEQGLSYAALAKRAGCSQGPVQRAMQGNPIGEEPARLIAIALNLPTDALFPGFGELEAKKGKGDLTPEERAEYAELYLPVARQTAWKYRYWFLDDFSEALSIALVAFAEVLFDIRREGGCPANYIRKAIYHRFCKEKQLSLTDKRRANYAASLDAPIANEHEKRRNSLYSVYFVQDNSGKSIELREECFETIQSVPREQWANPAEADDLIACMAI